MSKLKAAVMQRWFVITAAVLIWLKTFVVQELWFDLPVDGSFQQFILFITPISSVLFMLWLTLVLFRKRTNIALVIVSLLSSALLFSNVVYYRFFNDFITLPVLFQTSNMGDLGGSILSLIKAKDLFMFSDFVILAALLAWRRPKVMPFNKNVVRAIIVSSVAMFVVNLSMAEAVRPELLTRTFDRQILVKSIGAYNYHVYDLFLNSKTKAQKAFADSSGLKDVEKYMQAEKPAAQPDTKDKFFGAAKGKNVIIISLESTQNFVINNTLYGQEITPFLNQFIQDSFYFGNFYHQTGQGKTSDAEFMVDNSLYPLPSGAVYFTNSQNKYNSTPKILEKYGYYSAVFHGNDKTFWNRDVMYKNLGYDRFFSKSDFNVTEENSVNYGLKDIPFFEQSVPYLKTLRQPFYTRFITLTNHFPFTLDDEDKMIQPFQSSDGTVNRYFQSVRYEDEALKDFIQGLKDSGLYDNTVIIMYGDHYGLSENHDKAMSQYLGKPITPYEHIQLQRTPFIIHIPGMKGEQMPQIAGEVDIRPTLLHLLGIEGENKLDFGHNLFDNSADPLVALRDGSFITKDYIYTNDACYRRDDGLKLEGTANGCVPYVKKASDDLEYSDKIIYGDLMRFSKDELSKDKLKDVTDYKQPTKQESTEDLPENVQEQMQREKANNTGKNNNNGK